MIDPTAIIQPGVLLPNQINIGAYSTIGFPPEHLACKNRGEGVKIQEGTIIREVVTIHAGMEVMTVIGKNCFIMSHAHIGHDCLLGDSVVIGAGAVLAGHVTIGDGSYVGIGATLHQWAALPAMSILGAGCFFKGIDHPPGLKWAGNPAKPFAVNAKAIVKHAIDLNEAERMIRDAEQHLKALR